MSLPFRKKKEVLLFGVYHGMAGLKETLHALEPYLKKGRKIGLEITQHRLDFFRKLYDSKPLQRRVDNEIKNFVLSENKKIFGKRFSGEELINCEIVKFWFEVYSVARNRGLEVVPLENQAVFHRYRRMELKLMQFLELIKKGKLTKKTFFKSSFYKKFSEVANPMRETKYAGKIIETKLDLAAVGASHSKGLHAIKAKDIEWKTVFLSDVTKLYKTGMKRIAVARKRYRKRIKKAYKRLKPREKPESKRKIQTLLKAYRPRP